jgi:hypothetical protein
MAKGGSVKVLAFILDSFIDPADPVGDARFNVNYMTSDGQLSSSLTVQVTIADSEATITADIKQGIADAVNTALGTSILKGAVRLF